MMCFANPPEAVKVTFGIYLNYYLDEDQTSNSIGIVDYQLVKKHIIGDSSKFTFTNDQLLKQLEAGDFEKLEPRLFKLCVAIAYNKDKYDLCVQKAITANVAAGQVIKMIEHLAQFYFTFIFQKETDEMS